MSSVNNIVVKYFPIGLSIPFVNSNDGYFEQTFDTNSQVKQNLLNFLKTKRGERRMQPEFGTKLYNLLFEQLDANTYEIAKSIISEEITAWIPQIIIDSITVNNTGNPDDTDNYKIGIAVVYRVRQTQQQDSILLEVQNMKL
jgi:uncharacterized protein